MICDGRGKHTWLVFQLGIRVDDTPQSILPVTVKMTGVTVLIIDRLGFPMGGLALVASQTIFTDINPGKILLGVGRDLNRGEPGQIADRTALGGMTGPAGLL